jgi:hypothetical protein
MAAQSIGVEARAPLDESHIVLESRHEPRARRRAATIAQQFDLKSLLGGPRTRLTIYKEGLLAVRTSGYGVRPKECTLDLRYLDPRPTVSRSAARQVLYPAGGAAALAAAFAGATGLGALSPLMGLVPAFALGAAACILALRFLHRAGERAVFRTARGQAEVLVLFGAFGAAAELRQVVPAVVAAIHGAGADAETDNTSYLRDEIREHYRLAQSGVISEDECSTSTQRILHQFV